MTAIVIAHFRNEQGPGKLYWKSIKLNQMVSHMEGP